MDTFKPHPSTVVVNSRAFTADRSNPWIEAFAVDGGIITATGTTEELLALAGPETEVVDLEGAFALPGLSDVHVHLSLGGTMFAFELGIHPADNASEIIEKVGQWAPRLEEGDWVVGGIVGSTVLDSVMYDVGALKALDAASAGHPVMLRDDSMHNRWVNSAALDLMGITPETPDPHDGRFVKDAAGNLTGVLHEAASAIAEAMMYESIADHDARARVAVSVAASTLNSFGITSAQEAATLESNMRALKSLDDAGELHMRVVASMPYRPFPEPGITGPELFDLGEGFRTENIRPDFVKLFLDGVPMTRTVAMLGPYVCHHEHGEDPDFRGELMWSPEELETALGDCIARGLHVKIHAAGDGSTRAVLDAVEKVRADHGGGPRFQIAHTEFVDQSDIPRFAELGVIADASPHIWFPSVIQDSIANQIPAETVASSWPVRSLLEAGANVSAGSDWPCSQPSPSPWLGLGALVSRTNPDPAVPGELNPSEAVSVAEAIIAFTAAPAEAMGLGDVTGSLKVGLSADFAVLDRNLFEIPNAEIVDTQVQSTWFRGRQVYTAPA